jgi:hypothetical protein
MSVVSPLGSADRQIRQLMVAMPPSTGITARIGYAPTRAVRYTVTLARVAALIVDSNARRQQRPR